jgi:uncharacterized protein YjbJ (UPF0337 family)
VAAISGITKPDSCSRLTTKKHSGKVLGDSKLESEGKGDQVKGKMQNAVGGIKDTLRGK